ncbi:MAG: ABC transporter permease [Paracoccus sp. (in: a-proteobacteria)]|uniref:ABC transporter permease n=1 Tax=Paracoccus sp. TaxID=267 RepID=UPI0039E3D48D
MSFSGESFLNFPPHIWSLRWYHEFFGDPLWLQATWLSARIALASTAIAMVLGATVSYALVRGARTLRPVVYALMLAPMVVPTVVSSIGVYTVLAPLGLVNSPLGLILAITPGSISYVVIILVATLTAFDARLEMASQSLGAGHLRTARRIIMPVILPGVVAAAIFAFIHAFDEVVISSFIAGSRLQTLPLKIWFGIQYEQEPVIAAVSTLMMALPLIALPFFGARTQVLKK